jgi:predicted metal-dependent enzyme (double-stranded beta helix superfamily)
MVFDLNGFIEECAAAIADDPVRATARLLNAALADPAGIAQVLPATGENEILLFHSSRLTIYRVMVLHGLQYPPHEHRMSVLIGLYAGCETNQLYRRSKSDNSRIEHTGQFDIKPRQVRFLDADVIHSVCNLYKEPSAALHVYLGDLPTQERSLWTLDLDQERRFDEEHYFAWARPLPPTIGTPATGTPVSSNQARN